MEKDIYGMNFHHGFGVECYCDSCRAEKNERITRIPAGKPIRNAQLIQRNSPPPKPNPRAPYMSPYADCEYPYDGNVYGYDQ